MVISKTSWHYKLLSKLSFPYPMPRTVCSYVTFLGVVLLVAALAIPGFVMAPLMFYDSWMEVVRSLPKLLRAVMAISAAAGIMAWIVVFMVSMFALIHFTGVLWEKCLSKYYYRWQYNRITKAPAQVEPREPGLLATWYRNIKERHCTLIEYSE